MAAPTQTASFHVLGASVTNCAEGKRVLLLTSEFPAAALVLSKELARGIGRQLIQQGDVSTKASHPRKGQPADWRVSKHEAKYLEIQAALKIDNSHGRIAKLCVEKGVKYQAFCSWFYNRKEEDAGE